MREHIDVEADEEGFYTVVAELLECAGHSYQKFPYSKRTRWNNRAAGNGRYPGFGIVRRFSSTNIHVQLTKPRLTGKFHSAKAVLDAILSAKAHYPDGP